MNQGLVLFHGTLHSRPLHGSTWRPKGPRDASCARTARAFGFDVLGPSSNVGSTRRQALSSSDPHEKIFVSNVPNPFLSIKYMKSLRSEKKSPTIDLPTWTTRI